MNTATPTHNMSERERALLDEELGNQKPLLTLRTGTRVDTGRWWWRTRLWLCLTEQDILLLAASNRRYIQRLPLSDCKASDYCHTTGVLKLEPHETWRFTTVALPPADAVQVLHQIENAKAKTNQPEPTVTEPHRA